MSQPAPCRERARTLIDRHFAARSNPTEQAAMHAHLETCTACRGHFQRHLLLADLDPAAPPARARIAAAVGLGRTRRPRAGAWVATLALGAAAAVVLLLAGRGPREQRDFVARGTADPDGLAALAIYCTSCGKPAPRLGDSVPARASLAFTYQNPTGWARLMVLAVDEQRNVYWYHPDPAQSPTALAIDRGTFPRELPWEIDQTFKGRTLHILALFGNEALQAATVEALVDASGCASLRPLGGACLERVVTVIPSAP